MDCWPGDCTCRPESHSSHQVQSALLCLVTWALLPYGRSLWNERTDTWTLKQLTPVLKCLHEGHRTELYQHLFLVYFSPSLTYEIKGKATAVPVHSIKAYGEQQNRSTLSSAWNSMEMSGQLHDSHLPPGEKAPWYPSNGKLCVAVLETRKTSCPCQESNPGSASPEPRHYTDRCWACPNIRTHINITPPSRPYTSLCLCHTIKHITVCKTCSTCSAQRIILDTMQICYFV